MGETVTNIIVTAVTVTVAVIASPLLAAGTVLGAVAYASVIGFTSLVASSLTSPRGNGGPSGTSVDMSQRNVDVMVQEPTFARRIVYGWARVSGPIVFRETTNNNERLHIVVALASNEISKARRVFFSNQELLGDNQTDAQIDDRVENRITAAFLNRPDYIDYTKGERSGNDVTVNNFFTVAYGSEDQEALSTLVSRTTWRTTDRLRGVAYVYCNLEFNSTTFPQGIPNISVDVYGKKLFDPRTNQLEETNNAALVVLDYLMNQQYGLRASMDEIDIDSFIAAANICDEQIRDPLQPNADPVRRYQINGVISLDEAPRQILSNMMLACGGELSEAGGRWTLSVGAFTAPVGTLTEKDLIGGVQMSTKNSMAENFNAVKGQFIPHPMVDRFDGKNVENPDPEDYYRPIGFPEVTSPAFEAEDGNERRFLELQLPFTVSAFQARLLARQYLRRTRLQPTVSLSCNLSAFKYRVGDTLTLTLNRFGIIDQPFEVIDWKFSQVLSEGGAPAVGVTMTLRATSPEVYALNPAADNILVQSNISNFAVGNRIAPPTLALSDELEVINTNVEAVLKINVSSDSPFVNEFEVRVRALDPVEPFVNLGRSSAGRFDKIVQSGKRYEVRARAITTLGARSDEAISIRQIVGKTAPPSNVQNFVANVVGGQLVLTWDAVPDLDLSHYKIRYSDDLINAEYQDSTLIVPRVGRPSTTAIVPTRNGTYFIKAVDKNGTASVLAAATVVNTNIEDIESLNVVAEIKEDPDFAGVKDGVVRTPEGRLILDSVQQFDEASGDFDDKVGLFDAGGASGVLSSGIYFFEDTFDLGETFTSRLTAKLSLTYLDYVDLFDLAPGLFDDRPGDFDGDPQALDDIDVELQVRTTRQDPALEDWSEYRTFVVGDYTARAFEFRAILRSFNQTATPQVSRLEVEIDMPDRVLSEDDLLTGAAPFNVTFTPAFRETPALGIAVGDLQQGDFYEITSKSPTGFTIVFKDSAGNPVSRRFDYLAKGFGRLNAAA